MLNSQQLCWGFHLRTSLKCMVIQIEGGYKVLLEFFWSQIIRVWQRCDHCRSYHAREAGCASHKINPHNFFFFFFSSLSTRFGMPSYCWLASPQSPSRQFIPLESFLGNPPCSLISQWGSTHIWANSNQKIADNFRRHFVKVIFGVFDFKKCQGIFQSWVFAWLTLTASTCPGWLT